MDNLELLQIDTNQIIEGLNAFDLRKSELQVLAESFKELKITAIDNKAEINEVSAARKQLKAERVKVQKEGKSMRDTLTAISRNISEKEKELVAIIEPIEDQLQAQEQWVESEKERIRLEEEAKENKRIQDRADKLKEYGFELPIIDLKTMSDESFAMTVSGAKDMYEKEQEEKRLAEIARLEQEEKERKEREAAELKLKADREELEALRKKQAEADAIVKAKQDRIAKEQADKAAELKAAQDKIESERLAIETAKSEAEKEKQRLAELEKARIEAADKERQRIADEAEAEKQRLIEAELSKGDKEKYDELLAEIEKVKTKYIFKSKKYKTNFTAICELLDKTINYGISKM